MEEIMTLCFYLVIMCLTIFTTSKVLKKDKKIYLWIPILILSYVAGLRAFSVGTDTKDIIGSIDYTMIKGVFSHSKDYIYYALCELFMTMSENHSFVLFMFALITNACVFFRLWDFKNKIHIGATLTVYFLFYFGMSMNITRQCLAISIIFYFSRFLENRKFKHFLSDRFSKKPKLQKFLKMIEKHNYDYYFLGIIIAGLIHISSFVGLLIPVFYLLFDGKMTKRKLKMILLFLGVCSLAGLFLLLRYSNYLLTSDVNVGLMQTVRALLLLGTYILYCIGIKLKSFDIIKDKEVSLIACISIFGGLLAFLSYIIPNADRIGYSFRIFEIVFYGMMFKSPAIHKFFKVLIYIALFLLGMFTIYKYSGITPYSIFIYK